MYLRLSSCDQIYACELRLLKSRKVAEAPVAAADCGTRPEKTYKKETYIEFCKV
jgi:hypothetical protein